MFRKYILSNSRRLNLIRCQQQQQQTRLFSISVSRLNDSKNNDLQAKLSQIDKSLASSKKEIESLPSLDSNELALRPELWKGLPNEKIDHLYRLRHRLLGNHYKQSPEELEALLSTAENPEEADFFLTAYKTTEAEQYFADDTDYDEYLSEGEFLDEGWEEADYDEYPTKAQDIVRDFRDQMQFNRLAAYELPSLAKYRKPYQPFKPTEKPVTYRYTTYLGETHPAQRKVVVSLKVKDLQLSEPEAHKFKLLAGVRYDFTDDLFKMSSDKFSEAQENAQFLNEILDDLIKESRTKPEEFAEVPLDTRHIAARHSKRQHKTKQKHVFPEEWKKPIKPADRKLNINELVISALPN